MFEGPAGLVRRRPYLSIAMKSALTCGLEMKYLWPKRSVVSRTSMMSTARNKASASIWSALNIVVSSRPSRAMLPDSQLDIASALSSGET